VPASPSDPASDYDQTQYTYTPAQQLATITDAAGNTWSYGYDLLGDQKSQSDPDAGAVSSLYDPAGQLMSTTDARGKTISYTYDADGRKTAEYDTTGGAAENSSDEIASWAYDTLANGTSAKGMPTSSTSYYDGAAFTEESLGYNAQGLSEGTETVIPSTSLTGALEGNYYTEDFYEPYTDELASYTDFAAGGLPSEKVTIGYNTANQPVALTSPDGYYVASLSYTVLGQPLEYTLGTTDDPVTVTDAYNQQTQWLDSQVTVTGSGTGTEVDDTAYSYDDVGDVLSEADTPSGDAAATQVQCFQYDYLGRLTDAWSQSAAGCPATAPSASGIGGAQPYLQTFSYDVTNNVTADDLTTGAPGAQTTVDATNTYPAPGQPGPHQLTSQDITSSSSGPSTATQAYNADGDLATVTTPAQTQTFTWDDANRLSSATTTPAGSSTGSTTNYLYDADGNLLLQADPGSTTLYLGDEQLVLDTSGTNVGTVSGTRYYSIGGETIAARSSDGTADYLIGDSQGTSQLAINVSNLDVTRRYFGPYGNELDSPPAAFPGDKGFVGGTTDPATGLTNLGAREYNPVNGQFISPDPLVDPTDPQDLNPYAYAADDPASDSDPSGAVRVDEGNAASQPDDLSECDTNITACEYDFYAANGGQTSGGVPDGKGYNPPPDNGDGCNADGCVSIITGQSIPIPPPLFGPPPARKVVTNGTEDFCGGVASRFSGCTASDGSTHGGGGFNLFDWIGHQVSKHWQGILQIGVFAACLGSSMVLCGVAEGADLLIKFSVTGAETGQWDYKSLAEGALIDVASAGAGYGLGKVIELATTETSGLVAADGSKISGLAGKYFGAFTREYIPRHAAQFIARHEAPMFLNNPAPVLAQITGRAFMNQLSCNAVREDWCP
jgi:RHS repeat-associated protein